MVMSNTSITQTQTQKQILDQEKFDLQYGFRSVDLSLMSHVIDKLNAVKHWKRRHWFMFSRRVLPIIDWVSTYKCKKYLPGDIMGGLMAGVFNIPQGLAFGLLAGVPPVYGLFTSIYAPIIYAILGSSRHVSAGCFSVVSLMVADAIQYHFSPLQHDCTSLECSMADIEIDTTVANSSEGHEAIEFAMAIAFYVGIVQILMALVNAGMLAVWLSDQMVEGLTTGAAVHIFTSQLTQVTGILALPRTTDKFGLVQKYICLFSRIGEIQWLPLLITLLCLMLMAISRLMLDPVLARIRIKFPIELLLVVCGTAMCYGLEFNTVYGLPIVGYVPNTLDPPHLSKYLNQFGNFYDTVISIAVVGFAIEISIAKLMAKKYEYDISANQEWFALGSMHLVVSFFSCIAGGGSLSRTMLRVQMGAKTQLASLISSVIIVIVILSLAQCLEYLPKSVLAAIIIFALKPLFVQLCHLPALFRKSFIDFSIWIVTFGAVVLLNVTWGLVFGLGFALLTIVFRSQLAVSSSLGIIRDTGDFKQINAYQKAVELPAVKIYRFDAPLLFANADLFLEELQKKTGIEPLLIHSKMQNDDFKFVSNIRLIIIDCSSFPYVDLMAVDVLAQAYEQYKLIGIRVLFAQCKIAVRQMFERCDFYERVPKTNLYVTVSDAVEAANQQLEEEL